VIILESLIILALTITSNSNQLYNKANETIKFVALSTDVNHGYCLAKEARIDLDRVWIPSELVTNAYKGANAMELFAFDRDSKSEYFNEARIWTAARASDPPAKIGHNIFSLYRKKVGNKEYLLFHEKLWTHDYFQNILDWSRYLRVVAVPVIVRKRSINPAAIR